MKRASGSTSLRSPGMQKNRQRSSKPSGAPSSCSATRGRPARGRKFVNAPAARSTASRSILPRSAARMIGGGSAGTCSSLNPVVVRSPAKAASMKSTVSAIRVSGFENGMSFQPSTIRSDDAPIPSANRPPERSASAAACCASSAGPRVNTPTTPVPSRARSVHVAAAASGVKPSGPLVSPLQMSV